MSDSQAAKNSRFRVWCLLGSIVLALSLWGFWLAFAVYGKEFGGVYLRSYISEPLFVGLSLLFMVQAVWIPVELGATRFFSGMRTWLKYLSIGAWCLVVAAVALMLLLAKIGEEISGYETDTQVAAGKVEVRAGFLIAMRTELCDAGPIFRSNCVVVSVD